MGYKVLLVEDDHDIREAVADYFTGVEESEMNVNCACDGIQAEEMLYESRYDLVLLDIMLPGVDGWELCRQIRKTSDVPVIFLTARARQEDVLYGYTLGCDDYVVKPFSPKELMARVKAVLNRHHATAEQVSDQRLKFEGLEIDLAGREVYVDGQRATMTPKEYDLLFYLVKNKGLALSRDKLLEAVWGYDFFGDDRTVDTHIKMLRGSLGVYRKFIVTLRGMGYKFDPDA